ncbi:MAG: hypothetical protein J6D13_02910 [Clostridium sp.]|nr:hypothetical protein [Clostridium sp.]
MSSKTKIVVLRMKEIIYTAIFLGLGILLITLFLIMFRPGKKAKETSGKADGYYASQESTYLPGVYTSSLVLGSQGVNVEVTVDSNRIKAVTYTPLSDSVKTMYPLIEPAVSSLAEQIVNTQSLENLTYPEGSLYTSQAIKQAVGRALDKAEN